MVITPALRPGHRRQQQDVACRSPWAPERRRCALPFACCCPLLYCACPGKSPGLCFHWCRWTVDEKGFAPTVVIVSESLNFMFHFGPEPPRSAGGPHGRRPSDVDEGALPGTPAKEWSVCVARLCWHSLFGIDNHRKTTSRVRSQVELFFKNYAAASGLGERSSQSYSGSSSSS